jgi:hypothetical protein
VLVENVIEKTRCNIFIGKGTILMQFELVATKKDLLKLAFFQSVQQQIPLTTSAIFVCERSDCKPRPSNVEQANHNKLFRSLNEWLCFFQLHLARKQYESEQRQSRTWFFPPERYESCKLQIVMESIAWRCEKVIASTK